MSTNVAPVEIREKIEPPWRNPYHPSSRTRSDFGAIEREVVIVLRVDIEQLGRVAGARMDQQTRHYLSQVVLIAATQSHLAADLLSLQ